METKQKKTKLVMSLLALAGLAVFSLFAVGGSLEPSAPPGPTMKTLAEVEPRVPIRASDLPLVITEPNSYYLVEDINFTNTANHAITINCNDVTIDLMGYTLKGPDSGINSGIYMYGRTNVEIRNGTIRDFGLPAIYENSSTNSSSHRVVNIRALSNGFGIYLYGYGHLIKDCTAAENGTDGIHAGSGCTVTGNTAYQNGSYGIYAGTGCTVTGNTAYNNGTYGIYAGSGSTVTGNTANYNGGSGIYAGYGCTISGNTIYANQGKGIHTSYCCMVTANTVYSNNLSDTVNWAGIYAYNDCLVKGNIVRSNKQNNIYVYASDNAIEENLVTDSPGNGIYFNSTGNFYANNRASGNGTNYANTAGNTDGGGNYSF